MVTSNDLKGIMAMMPAFITQDGDPIDAMDTVDTDDLTRAVDRLIRDGRSDSDPLGLCPERLHNERT